MLFIWDIHITSKHTAALLAHIYELTKTYPAEEHIIFLGDYVYHFSYDRKALLQLFSVFIELASKGKYIYILAGNHDRISWHFVFEEARQTLLFTWSTHIHFITHPTHILIEGVACLFFPFYHPNHEETITDDQFPELRDETHPQRIVSRKINNILAKEIAKREKSKTTDRLLLIHHRYIAKTKFPWQQAIFSYESPALDPRFLDNPSIRAISGHLHEWFAYKQYLCTGSIWHTSPLETNQQKFVYLLNPKTWKIHAHALRYNPYIQIPYPEKPLTKDDIMSYIEATRQRLEKQLNAWSRIITCTPLKNISFSHTTITITTEHQSLQDLPEAFEDHILKEIGTIKHKLICKTTSSLISELDRASLDLSNRFSDRKILLRNFLEQKYWTAADRYLNILEEEKLFVIIKGIFCFL
jgi:UDP-2,3-diacylglucosamine pyrophosphatase LpxH